MLIKHKKMYFSYDLIIRTSYIIVSYDRSYFKFYVIIILEKKNIPMMSQKNALYKKFKAIGHTQKTLHNTQSKIYNFPFVPSNFTFAPFGTTLTAFKTSVTHGMPISREIIPAWLRVPPPCVTIPPNKLITTLKELLVNGVITISPFLILPI